MSSNPESGFSDFCEKLKLLCMTLLGREPKVAIQNYMRNIEKVFKMFKCKRDKEFTREVQKLKFEYADLLEEVIKYARNQLVGIRTLMKYKEQIGEINVNIMLDIFSDAEKDYKSLSDKIVHLQSGIEELVFSLENKAGWGKILFHLFMTLLGGVAMAGVTIAGCFTAVYATQFLPFVFRLLPEISSLTLEQIIHSINIYFEKKSQEALINNLQSINNHLEEIKSTLIDFTVESATIQRVFHQDLQIEDCCETTVGFLKELLALANKNVFAL